MPARTPRRPDVEANVVINSGLVNTVNDDQSFPRFTF